MTASSFQIALLKVLIAVGWSDGVLTDAERRLIGRWMGEFYASEQQRNYLQYYLEQPTTRQQAEDFSKGLIEAVHSGREREEALTKLQQLAAADEHLDEAERLFLGRVRDLFESTGELGLFANRLRGFFSARPFAGGRSSDALLAALEAELVKLWRERDYPSDPYVAAFKAGEPPTPEQRSLLFVGALAGCTWGELKREMPDPLPCIRRCLRLGEPQTRFVTQTLVDPYVQSLDRSRLVRGVENYAERPLALGLVDMLFCLAAADGFISDAETETIRGVALGLKVTHRMFIGSKLRFSGEQSG
ncbi:TerB family tellurite resistance protein [Gloeobacter morelensis]|uniref:TerB family tellurite resistance protein n=1 Tax=Gloeobacter morelensis MG652769 TaxID=2781736 RepID=A0ABY3PJR2_9CYAN|nr:TerB family tellurite resistance protein [Gloeobacter morelensis]UFP93917.1 TerB family tellurite resistance protein [Gloeobacter morelensis MG652769]